MATPSRETLLGLDNVRIDLPIAPFPMRILGAMVDYFLFMLLTIAAFVAAIRIGTWLQLTSPWWFAALLLGYFVLEYGYFVLLEIAMNGQTPGKRLFGLRVTSRVGGRATPGSILMRNALRSLDIMIGVPFMVVDPLTQRLGDRLAGTVVLQSGTAPESVVRRAPPSWTAADIALAEEFMRRVPTMEPLEAQRVARRFLETIDRTDAGFLKTPAARDPLFRLQTELEVID